MHLLITLCYQGLLSRQNTGSLRWSYMNKIILSWNEKKLYTLRDILEKDSRRAHRSEKSQNRGSKPSDFEGLDKLIDKI